MNKVGYVFEPAVATIYRAEENCCITKVVIDGPHKGVYRTLDRLNEEVGVLLCYICDASRELLPATAEFFNFWLNKIDRQNG